ncbi:pre-rRNA-processing protein TSR2 homolog isoform X2 [Dreissena polymorpha]|uniref:pre-rRNA-processing protein TSR2 homolog isoform X2 n=1 Tax=Dreissena polymorpha TaxID=45954 RepID=UPI0022651F3F|nr:pre-rRNA-processing protein TSR2 homolog isoform X2 [Dreissena polymorpha]
MAASMGDAFRGAVDRILGNWPVLKLAVTHGFGGADSQAKAEWLVGAIYQWFTENANIETYELEDFLEDVLNTEFDTIADDGSLPEVAKMICGCYKLCQHGDDVQLRERLDKLPPCNLANCQPAAVTEQELGHISSGDEDEGENNAPSLSNSTPPSQQQGDTEVIDLSFQKPWRQIK